MSLSSRSLRRSVFSLLCMLSGVCVAQQAQQFLNVPEVHLTGGRVSSFLAGSFQQPPDQTDMLYINAPTVSGTKSSVIAGELLYKQGFFNFGQNEITFQDVTNVVAALGDFNNDKVTDYAFALSPTAAGNPQLCVYYGTGTDVPGAVAGNSSYSGDNAYPPVGKSGCMTIVIPGNPPNLAYIAAIPGKPGFPSELVLEDSANNLLLIFANTGAPGSNGVLTGFTLLQTISIPPADGAGPIYTGDFNNDGITDFIINGQTGHSASVYFGRSDGSFQFSNRYVFDKNVHSMLLQDMDRDKIADMVVEGDNGVIEIFKGNPDGTFALTSEGGTGVGVDGFSGHGGHLAAINPFTRDILTTTPIGFSVLQGNGSLSYFLKNIYNIGPGRASFAMADFFGTNRLDFAVDSPEGVAIVRADANGDGGFQTSNAYAALQPALGTVVGRFRNLANNPKGYPDVVAATGATQAQLLTGNGDGTFITYPAPVNTSGPSPYIPANLWSNILAGDFYGTGNLDIAYSLTGLPAPAPGTIPGIWYQPGIGDGTFPGVPSIPTNPLVPGNNNFFGETALGDFNGDGLVDVANIDALYDDTLLTHLGSPPPFNLGLNVQDSNNTSFNQVASGFFKTGRTAKQDLVFQEGANLIPYVNSGDGKTFAKMAALLNPAAPPLYPSTVLLTDIDGDGNGDIVVVYYNTAYNPVGAGPVAPNDVYIWYGKGDGTFGAPQIIGLSRNYYLGAVADMNGDGLPDIVLSDGSLLGILYNQGNNLFSSEAHYLAGQGINSLSIADVNGDGEPDLIVANGGATISNAIALGGQTAASLSLTPNPDVNTGGITVLLNSINTKPVTETLIATPEPSNFGATFTLIATLTPTLGVAMPTGSVQFYIDGSAVGLPVTVVPGPTNSTATYTIPAGNIYAGGSHALSAIYSGDTVNSPITLSGTHFIQGGTTTTALNLCVGPTLACPSNGFVNPPFTPTLTMIYGQTYNGTVVVTASDGGALPGNTLIYDAYNGAAPLLLCTLATQVGGTCPPSVGIGAEVGTHVFTAQYAPGPNDTHTGSTSPTVTIFVTQDTSTATLTGAPNPSPAAQPVTFTATLTGNAGPPTGPVVFTYGATTLGTATLVPSTTSFTSTATLTTSTLPVGTDLITATYAGTLDFAAASATFAETITPSISGTFTLTVTPTPVSVGVGYATLLTVKVTGQNGFAQAVNLTCSNLPLEATCFFDTPQIATGGGTTELVVQTTAPHSCGTTQPYFLGSNGGPGIAPFALAGLLVLVLPGRRRWLRALVALIVVAAATQITGCGNCTDLGTRPATYTFQVTASSTGTSEVESQPVTITVTI
jgi:hypothetical protein